MPAQTREGQEGESVAANWTAADELQPVSGVEVTERTGKEAIPRAVKSGSFDGKPGTLRVATARQPGANAVAFGLRVSRRAQD